MKISILDGAALPALAEKLSIHIRACLLVQDMPSRIRVCLQAYRNSTKNDYGFSRWASVATANGSFTQPISALQ
jgi:hypothetical protein